MKTVITVNQLTKGYTCEFKNQKGLIETCVFETAASMAAFFQEYFDKPLKPRVIRRRKGLIEKTPLVNGDSLGA